MTPMAKRKRTAAQFFDDAETNDLKSLIEVNINNDKVFKHLESEIEINYNRMLIFWNKWVLMSFLIIIKHCIIYVNCVLFWCFKYNKRNFDVNFHDIKIAKHFIKSVVRDCNIGKKKPFMYIMFQK